MANIQKILMTSGSSWTASTWSPAGVPGADDYVFLNGNIVRLTTETALLRFVSNQAGTGAVAGGYISLEGTVAGQAILKCTDSNALRNNTSTSTAQPGVVRIAGGFYGTIASSIDTNSLSALASDNISNTGGNLIMNGNYSINNGTANATGAILNQTGGTTTINGNVASAQVNAPTTPANYRNTVTMTGGTVTINGNVSGGTATSIYRRTMYINGGTLNINNALALPITGITAVSSGPIYVAAANTTMNIVSNIKCDGSQPAIYASQTIQMNIEGYITGNINCAAIICNGVTSTVRIKGVITNTGGTMAVVGARYIFLNPTTDFPTNWIFQNTAGGSSITYQVETSTPSGDLSASSVRKGNTTGNIVGTMVVPANTNVRFGTAVDAPSTVGTLKVTDADFWNVLTTDITTSNSMGLRLKTVSTVSTLGNQLTSYNG